MKLVETFEQLQSNAQTLERIRVGEDRRNQVVHQSLIQRGRTFLPYLANDGLAFAPSRFIGYIENSLQKHESNTEKDGRLTNPRIAKILSDRFSSPISNAPWPDLEEYFLKFAAKIGVVPNNVLRSYWNTPEISEWLEENPIVDVLVDEIRASQSFGATTKKAIIQARVGQGIFRKDVIKKYRRCLITGVEQERLLVASHIKPWRHCYKIPSECLSPENALLLTPTWDALFDKGFISFSDDGEMLLSNRVEISTIMALRIPESVKVDLACGQRDFMKFHRKEFDFKGC